MNYQQSSGNIQFHTFLIHRRPLPPPPGLEKCLLLHASKMTSIYTRRGFEIKVAKRRDLKNKLDIFQFRKVLKRIRR